VKREGSRCRTAWPDRMGFGRSVQAVHLAGAPAVAVANVAVSLDGRSVLVGVDFELAAGRQLALVGPNGAGKTTLLRVLAGLLSPSNGEVRIHGDGPCGHVCIAYVQQKSGIDWRFPVSVHDAVMMGRVQRIGPLRRPGALDRRVVRDVLDAVELSGFAHRRIEELSGGEQQRLFLARALAQQADLLLLDEPLSGLDAHSGTEVLRIIASLRSRKVTVIVALHDLGIAATSFDEVLLLKHRMIGHGSANEVFTEANLREAYGSCLHLAKGESAVFVIHDTACSGGDDELR